VEDSEGNRRKTTTDFRKIGCEVHGNSLGLCSVAGFGISGVELSGSAAG
jgi:hypothetical protein